MRILDSYMQVNTGDRRTQRRVETAIVRIR
jgi:hypothetical protein